MWQGLKVKAIDLPNVLGCLLITDTRPVLKQRGRKREREEKKKKPIGLLLTGLPNGPEF